MIKLVKIYSVNVKLVIINYNEEDGRGRYEQLNFRRD
jgi:hypothetical protein